MTRSGACGVMASTVDSESTDPGSNPGRPTIDIRTINIFYVRLVSYALKLESYDPNPLATRNKYMTRRINIFTAAPI